MAIYELCLIILQTLQHTMKNSLGGEDVERPLVARSGWCGEAHFKQKPTATGLFGATALCTEGVQIISHACKYDVPADLRDDVLRTAESNMVHNFHRPLCAGYNCL